MRTFREAPGTLRISPRCSGPATYRGAICHSIWDFRARTSASSGKRLKRPARGESDVSWQDHAPSCLLPTVLSANSHDGTAHKTGMWLTGSTPCVQPAPPFYGIRDLAGCDLPFRSISRQASHHGTPSAEGDCCAPQRRTIRGAERIGPYRACSGRAIGASGLATMTRSGSSRRRSRFAPARAGERPRLSTRQPQH